MKAGFINKIIRKIRIRKLELNGFLHFIVHQVFPKTNSKKKSAASSNRAMCDSSEKMKPEFRNIPREKCIGCGLCFAVCKFNAIKMTEDESGFMPGLIDIACTNCGMCSKVCPGINVQKYNGKLGDVSRYVVSHARDENVRYAASSGGTVRSILISLLEKKIVDKVIITRATDDPYHPETIITDSIADLYSDRLNSIYSPTSPLAALKNLDKNLKYAFVGLPCHIAGLKCSPGIKKNIFVSIGIFCSHTPSFAFVNTFLKQLSPDGEVRSLRYRGLGWPGKTKLIFADGKFETMHFPAMWHKYNYNKVFQQSRCRTCTYYSAEFADISIGDPWSLSGKDHAGSSLIFIRNKIGEDAVAAAAERITAAEVNGAELKSILKFHEHSAESKQKNV